MTRGSSQVSLTSSNASPAAGGEIAGSDVWDCVERKIWGSEMNVLFTLYAWDHAEGGLHHGLAHIACAIIAGNRHNGYLSESRNGPPLLAEDDGLLRAGDYYFHIPHTSALSPSCIMCVVCIIG